jgi:tight adherence protein B
MLGLTFVLLFVDLVIGVFALLTGFDRRNEQARALRERLDAVNQVARRSPGEGITLLRDELLSGIPALNRLLMRYAGVFRLQAFLMQADVSMRPGRFLLFSACFGAAGVLLIQLVAHLPVAVEALFLGVGLLPAAWVETRRRRRFQKFQNKFPEAIDFLARLVRSGHSFNAAMEVVANEFADPVAGEFRRVSDELKFGLPLMDTMLNLAGRIPSSDVKFFITAVMLQRKTGGNLAELLDKLSYLIRERLKIVRQVRVYTASGRVTVVILSVLPPAILITLLFLSPELVWPLLTNPIGQMVLAAAATLQIIGFLLIRRIVHIRV